MGSWTAFASAEASLCPESGCIPDSLIVASALCNTLDTLQIDAVHQGKKSAAEETGWQMMARVFTTFTLAPYVLMLTSC